MSNEGKTIHPVARAILAILALAVIVISGNMLVSSLGIGHKTLDLTENKVHSLSDGTKAILGELPAPVVIRYYASRNTRYMPEDLKLHMRRVDDLLAEYQNLSKGKLQVENLDPEPDTDAEDAANLDGLSGQSINGENLYFGLAIACIDRTRTIPFLNPNDETMLEYEISRAIAEVSDTDKPVIGLMSAVQVAGSPMAMMGQGGPPWVIYNQLSETYEVEDVGMGPDSLDPEKYDLVLVIHPADITAEAEFALDQYVLGGGTVIACLDPQSIVAQQMGGGNPMAGANTSSTLPTLLPAWGIEMSANQVIADPVFMDPRYRHPAVLTIPQEGMPEKDNVVTRGLDSVTFLLPGGLYNTGGKGLTVETLVTSSEKSGLVSGMSAMNQQAGASLLRNLEVDAKHRGVVMHVSGPFKTAFPDGKPGEEKAEEKKDDDKAAEDGEPEKDEPAKPDYLKEATAPGNVFIIADVDGLADRFAFSVQRLGQMQLASQISGTPSLLFNLIDQAASSTHLIGARSRAAISRPFTRLQKLEDDFRERAGAERDKKQAELDEISKDLNELVQQRAQGDTVFMDSDIEAKIREAREKQVKANKELREMEKDLRRQKDAIATRIKATNLLAVPVSVLAIGLCLFGIRRSKTRAR